jgi:hypothetical protein
MDTFQPFQKIARYSRDIVITEKIDGTNAQILIAPPSLVDAGFYLAATPEMDLVMLAGSRKRWLERGKHQDNYGFAEWVFQHQDDLWRLGPGRHFGEWWGKGINRGYGLDEKRFSLFNVHKWGDSPIDGQVNPSRPACCSVVPVLHQGPMSYVSADTYLPMVELTLSHLKIHGSFAAPGFMDPEGIVIYHTAGNVMFKKTIKDDEKPKG